MNTSWQQTWRQKRDQFNSLTRRERLMIGGLGVVAVLAFVYLPLESAWQEQQQLQQKRESLASDNILSDQQIHLYEAHLATDPNIEQNQKLGHLTRQLTQIDETLKRHNVVNAQDMSLMLQKMLSHSKGITIRHFESIPVQPLLSVASNSPINLYRHGIKLSLAGSYFEITDFLAKAEALPEKLYWHSLTYQVFEYPIAHVDIEFYTLSVSEEFISVAY